MTPEAWLFRLDLPAATIRSFTGLLAPAEQARAAAFRHDRDRDRFVSRRAQLRLLLAAKTGLAARNLPLASTSHGKPYLVGSDLRFSPSGAGDLGLCVLAGAEVGCDLAVDDPDLPALAIARHLFSPGEHRMLSALAGAGQRAAFLRLWARKEAVLKAIGTGLEHSPASVEVGLPGMPCVEVAIGPTTWTVADLAAPDGHVAAWSLPRGAMPEVMPVPQLFEP